jgi:hypothetical protein
MHERYAVAFRVGEVGAGGRLDVDDDRLVLQGVAGDEVVKVEIPFSELVEVRVGRRPEERLNGYRTLLLERANGPDVRVAPLGLALVHEIADLLVSLAARGEAGVLAVRVPLKPGCLGRARKLLAKGPPVDPAVLGLDRHEVYLSASEALFVFRGESVRTQIGRAVRNPALWRAGIAWQRCFASPPQLIDDPDLIHLDADLAYRWSAADSPTAD